MAATASDVRTEISEGILTLTLNRPKSLNSLTFELMDELTAALRDAAGDEAVRSETIRRHSISNRA
jgi:enoyl-CoA hydratase/carnithine racemase